MSILLTLFLCLSFIFLYWSSADDGDPVDVVGISVPSSRSHKKDMNACFCKYANIISEWIDSSTMRKVTGNLMNSVDG
ncbi:hypothetical protein WICPIJ_007502 [Wickerhamomyces pijperi]|uniref:Uncharacterized protein n=1 Tax=Wickerhamomyces pijperi TaxID=599730 RepID=A0A9P8Q007_WICPI|nr:hypothetical protein WICPIJ_007502 [Wickerhamomyces pijperi]